MDRIEDKFLRIHLDYNNTIIYTLLFLMSINFMNMFYKIFLLFVLCSVLIGGKYIIPRKEILRMAFLFLFSAIYIYVYNQMGERNISKAIILFSFPSMFWIGYSQRIDLKKWDLPIWVVVIGLGLHGAMNFLNNRTLLVTSEVRSTVDVWTKSEWIMTGQISLFIMLAGVTYYIFSALKMQDKPFLKITLICLWTVGMLYNAFGSTRTVVYASIINVILCIAVTIIKFHYDLKRQLKYMFYVLLVIFIIYMVYSLNLFGIKTWISDLPLFRRIIRLNAVNKVSDLSTRQGQITAALSQIFVHPWGKYTMRFSSTLDFIHNTWLNIAYTTGIIPAFLFFVYCILSLKDAFCIVKYGSDWKAALLILGIFSSIMTYWCLEPVCEAVPSVISLFCFIHGYAMACFEKGAL